jgi:flagellar hook-length control protein FliK
MIKELSGKNMQAIEAANNNSRFSQSDQTADAVSEFERLLNGLFANGASRITATDEITVVPSRIKQEDLPQKDEVDLDSNKNNLDLKTPENDEAEPEHNEDHNEHQQESAETDKNLLAQMVAGNTKETKKIDDTPLLEQDLTAKETLPEHLRGKIRFDESSSQQQEQSATTSSEKAAVIPKDMQKLAAPEEFKGAVDYAKIEEVATAPISTTEAKVEQPTAKAAFSKQQLATAFHQNSSEQKLGTDLLGLSQTGRELAQKTSSTSSTNSTVAGLNGSSTISDKRILRDRGAAPERAQQAKILSQIEDAIRDAAKNRSGNTLVVKLQPAELGEMTVRVTHRGDQLFARVSAESEEVEQALRNRSAEVIQSLTSLGLKAENIHMAVGKDVLQDRKISFDQFSTGFEGDFQNSADAGDNQTYNGTGSGGRDNSFEEKRRGDERADVGNWNIMNNAWVA